MKNKERFRDTMICKILMTLVEIILIVWSVYWISVFLCSVSTAEEWDEHEEEYMIAYAICTPGDVVNIRGNPNTKQSPTGYLEPGDRVYLDFKKRNGYWHAVNLSTEAGEGWIHAGYLVFDEPIVMEQGATIISNGRLAARKYVNGKRTRWLKPGAHLTVLVWSDEWCLTNCGYVRTEFLKMDEIPESL